MSKAAEIDIASVSKIYGSTRAVDAISLKIPAGTYCCLLGPSGCGKTSTLRMIAGHESISEGDIRLGNTVVTDLPPARRGTAMMFQSYALFPHLDLVDNVAFSLKMKGVDKDDPPRQGDGDAQADADGGLRDAPARAALRRPAAARGARPRADHRPRGAAARRAAFGARSLPQDPHAGRAEEAADLARHHLRACHAQPGGGDGARRPHRRDERRPHRAGRLIRGWCSSVPRPPSSPASWATTT